MIPDEREQDEADTAEDPARSADDPNESTDGLLDEQKLREDAKEVDAAIQDAKNRNT